MSEQRCTFLVCSLTTLGGATLQAVQSKIVHFLPWLHIGATANLQGALRQLAFAPTCASHSQTAGVVQALWLHLTQSVLTGFTVPALWKLQPRPPIHIYLARC